MLVPWKDHGLEIELSPHMVSYSCNPTTPEMGQEDQEFKANLDNMKPYWASIFFFLKKR